jgi:hypothetical protein
MLEKRGTGRGSHITGKSVHNTRIERLWRDMYEQCTGPYHRLFWDMEHEQELDPDSEVDLFCLPHTFKDVLSDELCLFVKSWNNHGLRTEHNRTPMQLFVGGLHVAEESFPDIEGAEEDFGADDSDSVSDEEVEGVHVASVHVPLSDLKYAELLLRFPQNRQVRDAQTVRRRYNEVRQFVRSAVQ